MGVQCQILINKAKEGVFRPGQAVRGKVRYTVDEATEYQDVSLSLIGKGKCVWREGSGKNRRTYRGSEDITVTHINVHSKHEDETVTLEGNYEHPFEFFLPEDIPRSHKDYIASISYRVQLKFVKPTFFSFNKTFRAEIPVYSYLCPKTEGPVIYGLEKELFAPFTTPTPVVNLKAEIEKTFLSPGENARITYEVRNDAGLDIVAVKTELCCHKTYTSDRGRKKYLETKVDNCETQSESIGNAQTVRFSCTLPTLPELYSINNSKVIEVEYRVKTTVRLPFPHWNASVEMPILIGEMKGSADPTAVPDDGEDPPSYWEAMNDKKDGNKSETDSD